MNHCAFCRTTCSGYPDGHWEDVQETLYICKACVEKVARGLIERGEAHNVHSDLCRRLQAELLPNKTISRQRPTN